MLLDYQIEQLLDTELQIKYKNLSIMYKVQTIVNNISLLLVTISDVENKVIR